MRSPVTTPTDIPMPQDSNGQEPNVDWYSVEESDLESEDFELEDLEFEVSKATFEDSLEAIQSDAIAPFDLTGFSDITRKQVHELRAVWTALPAEHRATIADIALMVARDDIYTDFGRFFSVLLEDESDAVRKVAIEGAATSEAEVLIQQLSAIASGNDDLEMREAALKSLAPHVVGLDMGVIADSKDQQRLLQLREWATDETWSPQLRAAALGAYAHFTQDDETGSIIESFVESGDEVLQMGALHAMGAYGPGQMVRFLERMLQSNDPEAREAAAKALGQSADADAVPMLTMTAREDKEPAVREAAYIGLGEQGTKQALRALEQLRVHAAEDDYDIIDWAISNAQELLELEDFEMLEIDDDPES